MKNLNFIIYCLILSYCINIIPFDIQKGITDSRLYNFYVFMRETRRIIDAARANNVEIILPVIYIIPLKIFKY